MIKPTTACKFTPGAFACLLLFTLASPSAIDGWNGGPTSWGGNNSHQYAHGPRISLLKEFRPIGASGNNLLNPSFDPVPGSAELAIAPLNLPLKRTTKWLRGRMRGRSATSSREERARRGRTARRPTRSLRRGFMSSASSSITTSISKETPDDLRRHQHHRAGRRSRLHARARPSR